MQFCGNALESHVSDYLTAYLLHQIKSPALRNVPCAVVQYNKWKGGGIIALSYEAKAMGVKRSMRGDEAKKKCPDIVLVPVQVVSIL